jgi:hypothetical protein
MNLGLHKVGNYKVYTAGHILFYELYNFVIAVLRKVTVFSGNKTRRFSFAKIPKTSIGTCLEPFQFMAYKLIIYFPIILTLLNSQNCILISCFPHLSCVSSPLKL